MCEEEEGGKKSSSEWLNYECAAHKSRHFCITVGIFLKT
jgi:hypothetical protein